MGRIYEGIDAHQREWIAKQPLFFVATAPLDAEGHVNLSPKGPIGSFRVLDDHTVAYLDVLGSGAETIAHLRENGRIVVMLCAFEGPPRILRLHGRGEHVLAGDPRFEELLGALRVRRARGAGVATRRGARARDPRGRLLRLRRAADGLRGRAAPTRRPPRPSASAPRARTRSWTTSATTTPRASTGSRRSSFPLAARARPRRRPGPSPSARAGRRGTPRRRWGTAGSRPPRASAASALG